MADPADLIVIGGGLSGLSLATRLVQRGYRGRVQIIEPRVRYQDDRSWAFWTPSGSHWSACATRTWDEWRQMLAAIKAQGGSDRFSILLPINEFEPLLVLGLQQKQALLREEGRWGNFSSEDFRRALGFYVEMFKNGWAPPITNNQIANVWNEFGRGYFSFYISGPWNIEEFKRRLPANQRNNWMTAAVPGPDGPGASTAGGSSLVVFKASKHKNEAWQLIEFLSSPAVQKRFHELTGNLPPRRAPWQYPALANDVYAQAFLEQLERVKPTPKVPEWERIVTEMQKLAAETVYGKRTVEEAVKELDHRVDVILEKRRWMMDRQRKAQP